MSFLSEIFSNRIKAIRQERGLTQAEAAELMGTDPANVSRWESGKHIPTEEALNAIAKAYGITADNFLGPEVHRAFLITHAVSALPALDNSQLELVLQLIDGFLAATPGRGIKSTAG